jgi:membrane protease YdiL (CAAX protease family)
MYDSSTAADLLAGAIVFAIPLTGPLERRIYRSTPATPLKLLTYGANVVALWALAAAAIWIGGLTPLMAPPSTLAGWLWVPRICLPVIWTALGAYIVVALLPLVQSLRGPRWRRAYAAAYRRGFSDIPGLIPNTATERAAFVLVSLTAGICEELLVRGFLIRFLHEGGFAVPLGVALVASSLVFGLAHLYQGLKGVAGTAVAGLVFGLVFLLSGSLIPCIILHVLLDLQVAYVMRPISEYGASGLELG